MNEIIRDAQQKGLIEIRPAVVLSGHPMAILKFAVMLSETNVEENNLNQFGKKYDFAEHCDQFWNWN